MEIFDKKYKITFIGKREAEAKLEEIYEEEGFARLLSFKQILRRRGELPKHPSSDENQDA